MADDLIPDWRVQVSLRFGAPDRNGVGTGMLNVRADDFKDLAELLDTIPEQLGDKVANVETALGVIRTVAQGTQGTVTVVPPSPAAQAAGAGGPYPACAHGQPRQYKKATAKKTGRPFEVLECALPFGTPGRCDSVYRNDKSEGQFPWPPKAA